MRKALCWQLVLLAILAPWAAADDVDIYRDASAGGYLLLALDLRPSAYEVACDSLDTCLPDNAALPALHSLLGDGHEGGVTHLDIALAQLLSHLSQPQLASLELALMLFVAGEERLPGIYSPLFEHRAELLEDLRALRDLTPPESASEISEDAVLAAWRDTLGEGELGRRFGQCPQRNRIRLVLRSASETGGTAAAASGAPFADLLDLLRPRAHSLAEPGLLSAAAGETVQVFLPLLGVAPGYTWPGNLKKYYLGSDQGEAAAPQGRYVDAAGEPVLQSEGAGAGRISPQALSDWTDPAALPSWAEGADGDYVRLGGFGDRLRQQAAGTAGRHLYLEPPTINPGEANPLIALSPDQATLDALPYLGGSLGAVDPAATLDWIHWLRGQDRDDTDGDGDTREVRPWLLGGLFHSRPLVLRYGPQTGDGVSGPRVRVFVGSGSGMLHAIDNTDGITEDAGREAFAYLPLEMLADQALRRAGLTTANQGLLYGVDGSPVALLRDHNGDGQIQVAEGDRALLYVGLRRGGAAYYALEVSDPAEAPSLRWKILPGGDYPELALSFAEPLVGRVQFEESPRDVVIVSAGYHGGRDAAGNPLGKDAGRAADPRGNALYMVDAFSGELLWKAVQGEGTARGDTRFEHPGLQHSIPSRPAALRDSRGLIYRLYVGDSGGNLWRVDVPPGEGEGHRRQHWSVTQLAAFSEADDSGDRRFFHPPDIVRARDGEGRPFDGVLIASGNRAAPNATETRDGLFYLRDYAVAPGAPLQVPQVLTAANLPDRSDCAVSGTGCEPGADDVAVARGWRLMFPGVGEKGLSAPLTEAGTAYLTSFVPATEEQRCTGSTGHSVLYRLRLSDAGAATDAGAAVRVGEGLSHGVIATGDGLLLPGVGAPGLDPDSSLPHKLIPQRGAVLYRLYWREPGRDDL
ncbi:pilus assembly protein [Parahaliea aestuarii]